MKKLVILSSIVALTLLGCSQDNTEVIAINNQKEQVVSTTSQERKIPINFLCGKPAVINSKLYYKGSSAKFKIKNVSISGDCLSITYISRGCTISKWKETLVDSKIVTKPIIPGRNLRLLVNHNIPPFVRCIPQSVTKTVKFNVSNLRIGKRGKINLFIKGFKKPVLYKYGKQINFPVKCGKPAVIDSKLYHKGSSEKFKINKAAIKGNCLSITYTSRGCTVGKWEETLVDSDFSVRPYGQSRSIKLLVNHNTPPFVRCITQSVTKTVTFDVSNLIFGFNSTGEIKLNLQGYDKPVYLKYGKVQIVR